MKVEKKDIIHIIIIVLGIIFVSIPVFHGNLWFDESYSVGIANHGFKEIWTIGGNDVHPVLYYWVLHIINIIFGNKIIAYRLFSLLCIAILGVLGYTHIRKDFGKETGILFSFFAYFFPTNVVYAGEIRMYTFAMLLVTLMGIYAYRIYKQREKINIKNWVLFGIFSLASAYTHYYGLMAAGIINLMLFISFIIESIKTKKITYNLKMFLSIAIIQVALYIPWLLYLLLQVNQVSGGFWIGIKFPDTLIEFFTFQFTGNLGGTLYISKIWAILFGLVMCAYMIFIFAKNKKEEELKPGKLAIIVWLLVALGACIVSLVIWRPIIYARYMFCVGGLFIFFFANTMVKRGNKNINIIICCICVLISSIILVKIAKENYAESNYELLNYLSENMKETDAILHENQFSGFVVSANYPKVKEYFWNKEKWNVEKAYKAFGKDMETIYDLDAIQNYKGRLWVINTVNYDILDEVKKKYEIEILDQKEFKTEYRGYQYTFTLIDKK